MKPRSGSAGTTSADKTDDAEKETTAVPVDTVTTSKASDEKAAETTKFEDSTEISEDSADADDEKDADDAVTEEQAIGSVETKSRIGGKRALVYGVLPGLALLLALGAGFLKWQDSSIRDDDLARIESVQFARDSTVAMLSYRPDTVDKDFGAARELLTGDFKNAYTSLTNDVVIPGAKQKQISAVASVPAVASVSADPNHAVALVFVNQTVIVGTDAPTDTASSVKVTMDKVGGCWLISGFDPI